MLPLGSYDFVHLPWDTRRTGNITFAFLNLVDAETALRAFFALSGFRRHARLKAQGQTRVSL